MKSKFKISVLFVTVFLGQSVQQVFAQPAIPANDTDPVLANDTNWYSQPWIWFIILAMLALGMVYYVRNTKKKNLRKGTEKGLR